MTSCLLQWLRSSSKRSRNVAAAERPVSRQGVETPRIRHAYGATGTCTGGSEGGSKPSCTCCARTAPVGLNERARRSFTPLLRPSYFPEAIRNISTQSWQDFRGDGHIP